jgi:endonuclease III
MVDPTKITDYNRNNYDLEELILFCVAVAGKTAKVISKKIDIFLQDIKFFLGKNNITPFEMIKLLSQDKLDLFLRKHKLGKYKTLADCYYKLAHSGLDLRKCNIDDLMTFSGIGPKTSRFFILSTRPKAKVAVLDTHILKYISKNSSLENVPLRTPSASKKYKELEDWFLIHCEKLNVDVAEYDLKIWNQSSVRSGFFGVKHDY